MASKPIVTGEHDPVLSGGQGPGGPRPRPPRRGTVAVRDMAASATRRTGQHLRSRDPAHDGRVVPGTKVGRWAVACLRPAHRPNRPRPKNPSNARTTITMITTSKMDTGRTTFRVGGANRVFFPGRFRIFASPKRDRLHRLDATFNPRSKCRRRPPFLEVWRRREQADAALISGLLGEVHRKAVGKRDGCNTALRAFPSH